LFNKQTDNKPETNSVVSGLFGKQGENKTETALPTNNATTFTFDPTKKDTGNSIASSTGTGNFGSGTNLLNLGGTKPADDKKQNLFGGTGSNPIPSTTGSTTNNIPISSIPGGVLNTTKQPSIIGGKNTITLDKALFGEKKEGSGLNNFQFGAKTETTETKDKPPGGLFDTIGGAKFGQTGGTEVKKDTATAQTVTATNPTVSAKPGEGVKSNLFPGVQSSKPETSFTATTTEKKGKIILTLEEAKAVPKDISGVSKQEAPNIEQIKTPEIQQKLEESHINNLMSRNIEDVINHWKSELDRTVGKFEDQTEKLKNFEMVFQKNFETVNFN
jgi:hypothetical protein